jgi:hypothetical protein
VDYYDADVYDLSDDYFAITSQPTIIVTSPNGGESWLPGSSQEITWTSSGASSYVAIYLYSSGSYSSQISSATTNDGSYTWSISSSQTESEYYQVKIVDYYDADVYDLSDDYFAIAQASDESCTYSISLYDSYGDGWHGNNYVNLYINGSFYNSYTLSSGSGPATYSFPVYDGNSVNMTFTVGDYSYECYYYIYDSDGNEVASDGVSSTTPTGVSFSASCNEGSGEDVILHYDDGVTTGGIGWSGAEFWVAARWEPDQLTNYSGMYLNEIHFIPRDSETTTYTLHVWSGTTGGTGPDYQNLVVSQTVSPTGDQWNEFQLDEPVALDVTQELWIGYSCDYPTGIYPAAHDAGPAVTGYGDMISNDHSNWISISSYDLDYNWNIQGVLTESARSAGPRTILPKNVQNKKHTKPHSTTAGRKNSVPTSKDVVKGTAKPIHSVIPTKTKSSREDPQKRL